ncbi:MAG: photosystem I reaction center subunit PsaK [Thermosynechococcaceae cyanobacterium]
MNFILLTTFPEYHWTFNTGVLMIVCNLIAIAIGRYAIQHQGVGPELPGPPVPDLLKGFGWPEFLATASFGHLLGAGMILGLRAAGGL